MEKIIWSRRVSLWVLALVVAATAGLYAYSSNIWVGGNNEYTTDPNNLGLWATGHVEASFGEGATYAQTALNGFTGRGYCARGSMDQYGWCADSARVFLDGWYSEPTHRMNVVPYGWYFGTARLYVNGVYQTTRQGASYFQEPPNCDNPQSQFDYDHCPGSPIILATGPARNYSLTSAADGVLFDIDADGIADKIAWTKPGSDVAFLALDRNGNGVIDNGSELFGDHTLPGISNGFAALARIGGVGVEDGMVDRNDPLFANLLLWKDTNHNGISEADELTPFADTFDAIGLGYAKSDRKDGHGNTFRYEGWARRPEVGRSGRVPPSNAAWQSQRAREIQIYDVWFARAN